MNIVILFPSKHYFIHLFPDLQKQCRSLLDFVLKASNAKNYYKCIIPSIMNLTKIFSNYYLEINKMTRQIKRMNCNFFLTNRQVGFLKKDFQ